MYIFNSLNINLKKKKWKTKNVYIHLTACRNRGSTIFNFLI